MRNGGHTALALVQHRLSRQQRCGVSVGTKPKQRDIEKRAPRIKHGSAVGLLQRPLVASRRVVRSAVGRNGMNVLKAPVPREPNDAARRLARMVENPGARPEKKEFSNGQGDPKSRRMRELNAQAPHDRRGLFGP